MQWRTQEGRSASNMPTPTKRIGRHCAKPAQKSEHVGHNNTAQVLQNAHSTTVCFNVTWDLMYVLLGFGIALAQSLLSIPYSSPFESHVYPVAVTPLYRGSVTCSLLQENTTVGLSPEGRLLSNVEQLRLWGILEVDLMLFI
jgi:hypothetical protein